MDLSSFFAENNKCAIAFSGGVDSSYLLHSALKNNAVVKAYYIKSAFQPQFEFEDAIKMAAHLGADIEVIEVDVLQNPTVVKNPEDRCYYCKQAVFSTIISHANADGFFTLLDGTNASDDSGDRPGMKALKEMKVLSPLRECGLTKDVIRELSKEAGLFTWDKPAYACLATRIPSGEEITSEKLKKTELAEGYLFSLGFTDFRVRMVENNAKIQIPESQIPFLMENRDKILQELKKYYSSVLMDLEVR